MNDHSQTRFVQRGFAPAAPLLLAAVLLAATTSGADAAASDQAGRPGGAPSPAVAQSSAGLIKQVEITASDGTTGEDFANSVALDPQGTTAIVGAYGRQNFTGAAYVFTRQGSTWVQTGELTAADGIAQDSFGSAVAIAGKTAVVGAYGRDGFEGAVYVFTLSGSTWTQTDELTESTGAPNDLFGAGLGLASDGKTLVVGSQGYNGGVGAAFVYTRHGANWPLETILTAGDGIAGDYFGSSVTIDAAGDTILVGADGRANRMGAEYAFSMNGSAWTQSAMLTATDGIASDNFGESSSVSAAGNTVVVGAYGRGQNAGVAYTFSTKKGEWAETSTLQASAALPNDLFGWTVAIGADGQTVIVGAQGRHTNTGEAYIYTQKGSRWQYARHLSASDGVEFDYFGTAVALAASAPTGIVSSEGRQAHTGAAYLFSPLP